VQVCRLPEGEDVVLDRVRGALVSAGACGGGAGGMVGRSPAADRILPPPCSLTSS
jgi:hypothetical protein